MAQKTILVIHDDEEVQYSLQRKLGALGFNILQARTLEEAETRLQEAANLCLVVWDGILGTRDTLALIKQIKPNFDDVPMMAMSSSDKLRKLQMLAGCTIEAFAKADVINYAREQLL